MPPTSTYSFVSKLPVNNKWRVPATFLEIMRGINLPGTVLLMCCKFVANVLLMCC